MVRARNAVWIAICGSLAACGSEPPPVAAGAPAAAAKPAPQAPTDEVKAVLLGSASLPVNVGFVMPSKPSPGVPMTLGLSITSGESLERLEVLASSPGLDVSSETAQLSVAPVEAGRSYDLAVRFTPKQPGIADLGLLVRTHSASGEEQLRFAVPVLVEPPAGAGG
ncbi:MAG: hypothetical protein QM696_01515 [Steroidobacteraceae bacterium]